MPKRTDIHRCACTILRQAARVATQHFDKALATSGLRISQLSVLTTLSYVGPKSINDLAEIMVLDRTTLGRNLRPLQRDGFIAIEAGAMLAQGSPESIASNPRVIEAYLGKEQICSN